MKTNLQYIALAGGLLLGASSFAQDKMATPATTATTASPAPGRTMDAWRPIPLGYLTKSLQLTPEQAVKMKDLDTKYNELHKGLSPTMAAEERKTEVSSLTAKRDKEMHALFTPEQEATYAKVGNPTGARPVSGTVKPVDGKMAPTPKPADPAPAPKSNK